MSTGELPLSAAAELAELSALSSSLGFGGASSHGDEPLEELPMCEALFSVPGAPALTGFCRTPVTASVAAATPSASAAAPAIAPSAAAIAPAAAAPETSSLAVSNALGALKAKNAELQRALEAQTIDAAAAAARAADAHREELLRERQRHDERCAALQARLDEQAANASSQHDQLSALSASAEEGQKFAREALDEQRATADAQLAALQKEVAFVKQAAQTSEEARRLATAQLAQAERQLAGQRFEMETKLQVTRNSAQFCAQMCAIL